MNMKNRTVISLLIASLAFASCGSDEPRYADPEGGNGEKRNCLLLNAHYEGANSGHMAYSNIATFDYADETTLRFKGFYFKDKDGWITFLRGEAEPGF